MKVNIIYWSGTGNTEEMAKLLAEGVKSAGAELTIKTVGESSKEDIINCDLVMLGSPAMGSEVIEEMEMEPFVEEIQSVVSGKDMMLFGSYGWGTGEWMELWEERMEGYGANLVKNNVITNELPEGPERERIIEIGKSLVK